MNKGIAYVSRLLGMVCLFATSLAVAGKVNYDSRGFPVFPDFVVGKTTYTQMVSELGPAGSVSTDQKNYVVSAIWSFPDVSRSGSERPASSNPDSLESRVKSTVKSGFFSSLKSRIVGAAASAIPGVGGQVAANVVSQVNENDLSRRQSSQIPLGGWVCVFSFEHGRYAGRSCNHAN